MSFVHVRSAFTAALRVPKPSSSFRSQLTSTSSSLNRITHHHPRQFHSSFPSQSHKNRQGTEHLRDAKIPYQVVRLVDPETKKLGEPQPFQPLLDSIIADGRNFLELVEEPRYNPESGNDAEAFAIVKLVNKHDLSERERHLKKRLRLSKKHNEAKEVQLTWNAAPGDVAHKIKKVREEIAKGLRVELVVATKQGQQVTVSPEEMGKKVREMVEMVTDVAREWRPRELTRRMTVVHLQEKTRPLPAKSPFHSTAAVAANAVAIPPEK